MNFFGKTLLITTGLATSLLCSAALYADDTPQSSSQGADYTHTASQKAKKSRHISQKKSHKNSVDASQTERISVSSNRHSTGGGMMIRHKDGKTVSTITSQYIEQQASTSTVADLVSVIPGVVASGDGTGMTTFQNFSMRGMNSGEIGILLEGMPASNAFTYSAYTPSLIDSQNMGSISVMQGSVDTNAAVYNATGGQISIALKQPSTKRMVTISGAGGTYGTHKEFIRFDTGEIGRSGVRAFISGSEQSSDMWRGAGYSKRWHVDAALVKDWSGGSTTEVLFGWNDSLQSQTLYPSMATWQSQGMNYGLGTDPTQMKYYKYNTKHSDAIYGTIKNHFEFGHGLSLDAQAYTIAFSGPYSYGSSININTPTYTGTHQYPANTWDGLSVRSSTTTPGHNGAAPTTVTSGLVDQYQFWRTQNSGLNLTGTWRHGFNTLKLGYWYSYAVSSTTDRYYPITSPGVIGSSALQYKGLYLSDDTSNILQQLNQLSIDDKMSFFHDKLTIDAGLRAVMVNRQATQDLPGANPRKRINNIFSPSPQVLISYRFNNQHQIYINGTTGYHLPGGGSAGQVSGYNINNKGKNNVPLQDYKPEYMIGEEIGYRYSGLFMFNAAGFHYNLTNHQINTYVTPDSTNLTSGSTTQLTNTGGLEAFGAQIELATRPWHHLSAYLTGSYLHTKVGNNIATGGDYLPTKGKQAVATPQFMGTIGLSYDDGTTFGRFNLHYVGKQYSTLMNDESMPAYFTGDINLGRRLPKIWRIAPALSLHLMNVGNNHYLNYVYSSTNSAKTITGVHGTSIKGSSPTYGIGQGFAAIAGISGTFE